MKISDKLTGYVLLRAGTNSEWDNCGFAIIQFSKQWKKEQEKRLKVVKPFVGDSYFQSLNYYDTAVDFFRADEDDHPDIENLLADKQWAFVELKEDEQNTFAVPENRLNCYRLVVFKTGTAMYTAYGKYTGEEFWTEEFSLTQLTTGQ